jgi:hypothetical protein
MSAIRLGLVATIAVVLGGCITITIDPPQSATPVAQRPLPAFTIVISPPPVTTPPPPTVATTPSPIPATPTPAPTEPPNGGMRRAHQRFDLDDGLTINDFRYQFPTAEAAAAFLDAEADNLGETEGLFGAEEQDPLVTLGDETRYYFAHSELFVIQDSFNYLIRVENVVAKVWIGGSPDVIDADEAAGIAQTAAERMVVAF